MIISTIDDRGRAAGNVFFKKVSIVWENPYYLSINCRQNLMKINCVKEILSP